MTVPADRTTRQRDDGPLALVLRARRGPVPPVTATLAGVTGWLAALFLVDDAHWQLPVGLGLGWLLLAVLAGGRAPDGRLAWMLPAALHLAEYVGIARLAALSDAGSLDTAYTLVGVVVLHHYDLVYRDGGPAQRVAGMVAGGWPGRLVFGLVVAAAGVTRPAFAVAAGCAFGVFAGEATRTWKDRDQRGRVSVADLEEQM